MNCSLMSNLHLYETCLLIWVIYKNFTSLPQQSYLLNEFQYAVAHFICKKVAVSVMKAYGLVEVQLHPFLTWTRDVSNQLDILSSLPTRRVTLLPNIYVAAFAQYPVQILQGNFISPNRESNCDFWVVHPLAFIILTKMSQLLLVFNNI